MQVPNFILPKVVTRIGLALPKAPLVHSFVFVLNQLLKRGIIPAEMELLAGKIFLIEILDAGLQLRFKADSQRFYVNKTSHNPDLRFAANMADFAKIMLREEDPDTLFFNRKLIIEGDTELGLIVKNLLDSIDWKSINWSPLYKAV